MHSHRNTLFCEIFMKLEETVFSMHASTIHFGSILTYFMTLSAWKCMQEALALNTFTTSQISSTVIDYFLRYLISDIASCHPLETSLNLSWIWYTPRVKTIRTTIFQILHFYMLRHWYVRISNYKLQTSLVLIIK